jgi:peroxiredoxin
VIDARQTVVKCSGRFAFAILSSAGLIGCAALFGCGQTETAVSQVTAPQKAAVGAAQSPPQTHEVHKEVAPLDESGIPQVLLSADHSAMCRVRVGDQLPATNLPQLSGGQAELAALRGGKATVVLFWQHDPWMSKTALKDLANNVALNGDVAVVGVAVKQSNGDVQVALKAAGADFPQLLDSDGKAFNQVGMVKMPRVYVLDGTGKIVWFDIEYSQSTSRELKQTLAILTASD